MKERKNNYCEELFEQFSRRNNDQRLSRFQISVVPICALSTVFTYEIHDE